MTKHKEMERAWSRRSSLIQLLSMAWILTEEMMSCTPTQTSFPVVSTITDHTLMGGAFHLNTYISLDTLTCRYGDEISLDEMRTSQRSTVLFLKMH